MYKKSIVLAALLTIPATAAIVSDAPVSANTAYPYDWQVHNVENLINQINPSSTTYYYDLTAAHNAYNALTHYQQTQVGNAQTLFYYLGTNDNNQHIINTFTTKMAAISSRKSSFIRDIEEANRFYQSLTAAQKATIPNYLYIQLQNYVENLQKMQSVQQSLEQLTIQDINYVSNYQTAMQAYNALAYEFRILLTTLANEKMREYEIYHSPSHNRSIAQEVMTAISKLSTSSTKQQVETVRNQYNALNLLQQRLVTNSQDLFYIEEVQRSIPYGWDPYYYEEDEEELENPTMIDVSKRGNVYTILMPVSDMERFAPTKITVSENISLTIPRSAVRVTNNNAVVAMTIEDINGQSIFFSTSMYNENFQFASYIDIEIKGIPSSATVLRLGDQSEFVATPYRKVGNKYVLKTKDSAQFEFTTIQSRFFDIQADRHRYEIEQLAKRKIVSGVEANYFKPNASVTLAQYATMISRAMALTTYESSTYRDVKGKWYESAIEALLKAEILDHKPSNVFHAEQVVTRKQAAEISVRMLQQAGIAIGNPYNIKLPFKDVTHFSSADRYYIALAYEFDIFNGKENGNFDPNGKLTRSQMAKVLHRTLQIAKMI